MVPRSKVVAALVLQVPALKQAALVEHMWVMVAATVAMVAMWGPNTEGVAEALAVGRTTAIAQSAYVRVVVDEALSVVRVEADTQTLHHRDLSALHHVTLRATRDTVTYAPTGLGWGLANTTIVVARGARAESVTVSRLGRVRTSW